MKTIQPNSSGKYVPSYNIAILNPFDPELQLMNTKPIIQNKLKEFLSELKQFKVQATLVLEYKKRNDCKIFHSSAKLIASDSYTIATLSYSQIYKNIYKAKWQG